MALCTECYLAAQVQVNEAFAELNDPRYSPALALFNAGRQAYDDRPRQDRDSCANIFDALESVAKEKFAMPHATFGQVVAHIRQTQSLNEQIVGVLEATNTLRNRNFGHGMAVPFNLSAPEVDFTYLICIGGILMITPIALNAVSPSSLAPIPLPGGAKFMPKLR